MTVVHYDDMWNFYRQNLNFNSSDDMIITVYKQTRKVNKQGKVQNFYQEERNNSVFKLEDKYKDIFPHGLFLCNDSHESSKSLLFVFPKYNQHLDAFLAPHWHFLLKTVKQGNRVGLHETRYIVDDVDNGTCFRHISLEYQDPITLPTSRFKETYVNAPRMNEALIDIIGQASKPMTGGMRKPIARRSKAMPKELFQSKEFDSLFERFETGYKSAGIKLLYVMSIKESDGTFSNSIGFIPRGRKVINGNQLFDTLVFNTRNTRVGTVRNYLIQRYRSLLRQ